MSDVTRLLSRIEAGDPRSSDLLLPLVYNELRALAAAKLAQEKPGHTLQATALVHEAYLRLLEDSGLEPGVGAPHWNGRAHFFGAAAEAMRRILIESARRRATDKRGGGMVREDAPLSQIVAPEAAEELLALDAALDRLTCEDPQAAELVKLRYFAELTVAQAAEILGVSPRKADFLWSFARAWLRREMAEASTGDSLPA